MGDALPRQIVADGNAAAVRIAVQALLVQPGEQLAGGGRGPEQLRRLPQHPSPGIGIVGTVVAVHHGHRSPGGGGDQVDLLIDLGQRPFQHHHGEDGGARRHVARPGGHGVGGGHAGARVALGGGKGDARSKQVVQQGRAPFGERARVRAGRENPGQYICQRPGQIAGLHQPVKLLHHFPVVVQGLAVDGEHTAGFAHTHGVDAGEHIMDVPRQGGDVGNLGNVGFLVQNGLVEVGDGPPLGNVEAEQGRQFRRRLPRDGVLPGAEGRQQVPVHVKSQIAVHHAGYAHGADGLPVLYPGQGGLQALPHLVQGVGPHAIFVAGRPDVVPGGHRGMLSIDGHCLDAGGTQFDAKTKFFHGAQPQGFSVG